MSRKPASDTFTRFTSTTPSFQASASTPSPSFTSQQPSSSPSPQPPSQSTTRPNETPRERVARLRAERNLRISSSLSTTDRLLAHGRRAADVAHRATTYTLLGFSAVATVVAAYGLVSLVSHNRTQKRAWIERELDKLEAARAAFLTGTASAEQLHLLEQERAGEELNQRFQEDKRRKKEAGWFGNVRKMFAGSGDRGVDEGERTLTERARDLQASERAFVEKEAAAAAERRTFVQGGKELELRPAAVERSAVAGVGLDERGRPVPMGKVEAVPVDSGRGDSPILEAVAGQSRRGGQLDMLAENISGSARSTGTSWWNSIFGGSRSS